MHIRSRFMGSTSVAGKVVRFDVRDVGLRPVLEIGIDGSEYISVETPGGEAIDPCRWSAWCAGHLAEILAAIPRAQARRIARRRAATDDLDPGGAVGV